jgi:hypothetical protein
MLDLTALATETARHGLATGFDALRPMLDALDLALTPQNALALGWVMARGEFAGLSVPRPVRMADSALSPWL